MIIPFENCSQWNFIFINNNCIFNLYLPNKPSFITIKLIEYFTTCTYVYTSTLYTVQNVHLKFKSIYVYAICICELISLLLQCKFVSTRRYYISLTLIFAKVCQHRVRYIVRESII